MDTITAGAYDYAETKLRLVDIEARRAHMKLHANGTITEFACHSAACRPPASGGTGGSLPGGEGGTRIGTRLPKEGAGGTTLGFHEISKEGLQGMVDRMHAVGALPKNIKTADAAADYIAHNITTVFKQVAPHDVAAWKEWYPGAGKLGADLVAGTTIPHHAANAMIASLSPGTDWNINVAQARSLFKVLHEDTPITAAQAKLANGLVAETLGRQHAAWEKKTGNARAAVDLLRTERGLQSDPKLIKKLDVAIASKMKQAEIAEPTLASLPHFKAGERPSERENTAVGYMARATTPNPVVRDIKIKPDGTYDDHDLVMTKGGKAASGTWQSYENIAKAVSVYRNPTMENISTQLGQAHKVRSFFNNINDPHNAAGDVTIDTHAYGIGLAKPLSINHPWIKSGKSNMTNTGGSVKDGTSGAYALFQEGYTRAAKAAGIEPREMQSVTWEQWRRIHTKAARAANVKRIGQGGEL